MNWPWDSASRLKTMLPFSASSSRVSCRISSCYSSRSSITSEQVPRAQPLRPQQSQLLQICFNCSQTDTYRRHQYRPPWILRHSSHTNNKRKSHTSSVHWRPSIRTPAEVQPLVRPLVCRQRQSSPRQARCPLFPRRVARIRLSSSLCWAGTSLVEKLSHNPLLAQSHQMEMIKATRHRVKLTSQSLSEELNEDLKGSSPRRSLTEARDSVIRWYKAQVVVLRNATMDTFTNGRCPTVREPQCNSTLQSPK